MRRGTQELTSDQGLVLSPAGREGYSTSLLQDPRACSGAAPDAWGLPQLHRGTAASGEAASAGSSACRIPAGSPVSW